MNKSLVKFLKEHYKNEQNQRVGQKFCNLYVKTSWPDLYYASDEDAVQIINQWLYQHGYHDQLPERISR